MLLQKKNQKRKGQALLEYALLIAGVALICLAAVSILGHKTSDMIGAVAATIPGAHQDDNAAIVSGKLIETTAGSATTPIALSPAAISGHSGQPRLGDNVLGAGSVNGFGGLVTEANP
jgi:pilus assembly protein Flp/PilA